MCYRAKSEQGLSLIELLVAMVILVIAITGLVTFLVKAEEGVYHLREDRIALLFAEGRLEKLIADRLATDAPTIWQPVTLTDNLQGVYIWNVSEDPDNDERRIITLTLRYPTTDGKEVRLSRMLVP